MGKYRVRLVLERLVVFLHDQKYRVERIDQIVEDDRAPLFALISGEATRVDDAHLLEDSGLAALSSTCD